MFYAEENKTGQRRPRNALPGASKCSCPWAWGVFSLFFKSAPWEISGGNRTAFLQFPPPGSRGVSHCGNVLIENVFQAEGMPGWSVAWKQDENRIVGIVLNYICFLHNFQVLFFLCLFVHLFVWGCVCGFVRLLFLPFISPVLLKEIALGINHLPFRSKYLKQY